jgi:hypothetical protein
MDQTLLDFIKSDKTIGLTIDGEVVPVIFLTIQRWTEFSKLGNSLINIKISSYHLSLLLENQIYNKVKTKLVYGIYQEIAHTPI